MKEISVLNLVLFDIKVSMSLLKFTLISFPAACLCVTNIQDFSVLNSAPPWRLRRNANPTGHTERSGLSCHRNRRVTFLSGGDCWACVFICVCLMGRHGAVSSCSFVVYSQRHQLYFRSRSHALMLERCQSI